MPADVLIPVPDGVSDRTASTLMMKGMTAQYLFRQVYPLKGGETILYHAAAGGVGSVACQWARAIGVTMIGTVSTDEKAEVAASEWLRAHHRHLARRHRQARARDHRRQGRSGGLRLGRQGHGDGLARQPAGARHAGQQRHKFRAGGDRHHAARRQRIGVADAAGDGALRDAEGAHAGDGRRAVRPCGGRPHHRRAQAELRARRCRAGAPRAESRKRHRATVLVPGIGDLIDSAPRRARHRLVRAGAVPEPVRPGRPGRSWSACCRTPGG